MEREPQDRIERAPARRVNCLSCNELFDFVEDLQLGLVRPWIPSGMSDAPVETMFSFTRGVNHRIATMPAYDLGTLPSPMAKPSAANLLRIAAAGLYRTPYAVTTAYFRHEHGGVTWEQVLILEDVSPAEPTVRFFVLTRQGAAPFWYVVPLYFVIDPAGPRTVEDVKIEPFKKFAVQYDETRGEFVSFLEMQINFVHYAIIAIALSRLDGSDWDTR